MNVFVTSLGQRVFNRDFFRRDDHDFPIPPRGNRIARSLVHQQRMPDRTPQGFSNRFIVGEGQIL
jgi:hypothetical protein